MRKKNRPSKKVCWKKSRPPPPMVHPPSPTRTPAINNERALVTKNVTYDDVLHSWNRNRSWGIWGNFVNNETVASAIVSVTGPILQGFQLAGGTRDWMVQATSANAPFGCPAADHKERRNLHDITFADNRHQNVSSRKGVMQELQTDLWVVAENTSWWVSTESVLTIWLYVF